MAKKTELDELIEDIVYVGKLRRQIEWDRMKDLNTSIHEEALIETEGRIIIQTRRLNERLSNGKN